MENLKKLTKNVEWPVNDNIAKVRYITPSLTQASNIPIPMRVKNGPPSIHNEPSRPKG